MQTDQPLIDFTPVPRQRRTRNGWTEDRQRGFIAALAECGSVSRAARSVGMSPRSAYRLMDADGADSFAAAWEASRAGLPGAVRTRCCDRPARATLCDSCDFCQMTPFPWSVRTL